MPDPEVGLYQRQRALDSDRVFRAVAFAAGALVLAILALITVSMVNQAWPAIRQSGLEFVTSKTWVPNGADSGPHRAHFGALAFVYGTAVASTIALVLAVPVSIGIALFTTEVVPRRLRSLVTTAIDLLAAVPSVVYGLWGVLVLAPNIQPFYDAVARAVHPVPVLNTLFGSGGSGRSFMTAGIILAIMITPIITSVSREVLNTVPGGEKAAALALGATRLGDDPGSRPAAQLRGHGGRGDARARAGDGGDDRGRPRDRLLAPDRRQPLQVR